VCTLPIWLGVRVKSGIVSSTGAFRAYGVLLQGLSVALMIVLGFELTSSVVSRVQTVVWLLLSVLGTGMLIDTLRVLWEPKSERLHDPIYPHSIFASMFLCMVLWLMYSNNLVLVTFLFGFVSVFVLRHCLGRHVHAMTTRMTLTNS